MSRLFLPVEKSLGRRSYKKRFYEVEKQSDVKKVDHAVENFITFWIKCFLKALPIGMTWSIVK